MTLVNFPNRGYNTPNQKLAHLKLIEFILERKRFFIALSHAHFRFFFEVKSVLPIDQYQNATSKAISQHELKKVQLQERYTLVTQVSIGHLKTLCISVLSLVVALESE